MNTHTPGPWRLDRGFTGSTWTVLRTVRPGFVEYLNAQGGTSGIPSRFRSEASARAAIAKAEPR